MLLWYTCDELGKSKDIPRGQEIETPHRCACGFSPGFKGLV